MTNQRTLARQDDTRYRVLRLLQEKPYLTQREIADELGISLGGVNYCLRALVDKGMVKLHNFRNSQNKIGYIYLLTPQGISEKLHLTEAFLKRKMREYARLKLEITALESELRPDSFQPQEQSHS